MLPKPPAVISTKAVLKSGFLSFIVNTIKANSKMTENKDT